MATVAELLVKIGANSSGLRKELAASQRQIKRAFGPEAMEASSVAVGRAGELMAVLSVAMTGVGVASVKMAASMEQNKIAFETMLGSAESANTFLQQLQSFAEKTPFTFDGLVTGSKRMLAMGFQANEIIPILTTIGDAVAAVGGTAESLDRVTIAFSQMRAKGFVSAEEMNQLAENGIPAWEMLAKAIGTDVATAMGLAEKKALDGNTAIAGMIAQMSEKYGGMMAKQSQTITGILSNIQDKSSAIMRDIGEQMVQAFDLKGVANNALKVLEDFSQQAKSRGIGGALVDMIPASVEIGILAISGALIGRMVPALYATATAAALANVAMLPWMAVGTGVAAVMGTLAYQASKADAETTAMNAAIYDGIGRMNLAGDAAGTLANRIGDVRRAALEAANSMTVFNAMTNDIAGGQKEKLPWGNVAPPATPSVPVITIPENGGAKGPTALEKWISDYEELLRLNQKKLEFEEISQTQFDKFIAEQLAGLQSVAENEDEIIKKLIKQYEIRELMPNSIKKQRESQKETLDYFEKQAREEADQRQKALEEAIQNYADEYQFKLSLDEQQKRDKAAFLKDLLTAEGDYFAKKKALSGDEAVREATQEAIRAEKIKQLRREIVMDEIEAAQRTKEAWADTLGDLVTGFTSLTDIGKQLWREMVDNWIRDMMRLPRKTGGLFDGFSFSSLFGGGSSNTSSSGDSMGFNWWDGFALGGSVYGPGTSTSDSIPAMLSNGEYVMTASAVDKFGVGFFDSLNNGLIPGFATGGLVTGAPLSTFSSRYGNSAIVMPKNESGSADKVKVEVHNYGASDVQVNKQYDSDSESYIISVMIDAAKNNTAVRRVIKEAAR